MKKVLTILFVLSLFSLTVNSQLLKKVADKIKKATENKTTNNSPGNTNGNTNDNSANNTNQTNGNTTVRDTVLPNNKTAENPVIKVYQNYDFVPGDKILFADNFVDDQDGEFPAEWKLEKGQAVLNKINGEPAIFLTQGNYVRVSPRMKTPTYLTDPFTVELDYYLSNSYDHGVVVLFQYLKDGTKKEASVGFGNYGQVSTYDFSNDLNAQYPDQDAAGNDFFNKWHHIAIIYKNNQFKYYVDQFRVLVMPDAGILPLSLQFGGIASNDHPIIFKNVRIASGGQMNMIGKKFTESKIVTHGINFDIDKGTIKPESMGTLNMIVHVMKDNPEIKFEVDGHTDNTGTAQHNLALSQQRADAVKDQLVKMGVAASRLTTKGFGNTKPISDNNSPEGKANNRRVEFVKM